MSLTEVAVFIHKYTDVDAKYIASLAKDYDSLQKALHEDGRRCSQVFSLERLCQVLEGNSPYAKLHDRLRIQLKNQIGAGWIRRLRLNLYCHESHCCSLEVVDMYHGFNEEDYKKKQ